jgi:tetratricopeptide (TPR) repeat protein
MGCCVLPIDRSRAESLYSRAVQIRRELLHALGSNSAIQVRGPADVAGELDDLPHLVSTSFLLANLLDQKSQVTEAEAIRRQLESDVVEVAAQLSEPRFQRRRQIWAERLTTGYLPVFNNRNANDMAINYRLAYILDSNNPMVLNNYAWSLVSCPENPWFNPAEGLNLARKAVKLEPNQWSYLNTLGVAAFRNGDWETAAKVLQQSVTFTSAGADDHFFLAMTYWQQGKTKEARDMYDRAVAWTGKNKPNDPELSRFRTEAAALLGVDCPKSKPVVH